MKFQGSLVVELTDLTISDIKGNRRRCAECSQAFNPGDKVIVIGESIYSEQDSLPLNDEGLHFVHLAGKQGGSCLEDFISRLLNNKPIDTPPPVNSTATVADLSQATPTT
jgi:hypothetical protein